jgi:hypothetical protein
MSIPTEIRTPAITLDGRSEDTAAKEPEAGGGPEVAHREGSQLIRRPRQVPRHRRRDDYLAGLSFVFVIVMILAVVGAVLYEPLPRAQLLASLAASLPATLTAALAWRKRRRDEEDAQR